MSTLTEARSRLKAATTTLEQVPLREPHRSERIAIVAEMVRLRERLTALLNESRVQVRP